MISINVRIFKNITVDENILFILLNVESAADFTYKVQTCMYMLYKLDKVTACRHGEMLFLCKSPPLKAPHQIIINIKSGI